MRELLSPERTSELLAAAHAGDEGARAELVEKNMALVGSIVRGFLGRGVEYDDLMQLGSLGLLKAIDCFDPSFGVRLSTYAVPMITGEIKRFLRDDGMIKVSRALKENAVRIYRAQEQFKREQNREATLSELAAATGLEPGDVVASMDAVREPVSIFEPTFDDSACLLDSLGEDGSAKVLETLMLRQLIERLSEREKTLIRLRFFEDRTQSEIASMIGVSQVQVSRLLLKAIKKLRAEAEDQM